MFSFLLVLLNLTIFSLGQVSFNIPPLQFETKIGRFEPMFERMQKIQVEVSPPNIRPRIRLLEHILLNMDFSYLDKVPSLNRLMFKLPNK